MKIHSDVFKYIVGKKQSFYFTFCSFQKAGEKKQLISSYLPQQIERERERTINHNICTETIYFYHIIPTCRIVINKN